MRTRVSEDDLGGFLEPLVGSSAAIEGFDHELRKSIAVIEGENFFANDPYDRLYNGIYARIKEAADGLGGSRRVNKALVRATSISASMIISFHESFGSIYKEVAKVPQDQPRVKNNVERVTKYATGMAHSDSEVAMLNRWALIKGVNPNDPSQSTKLRVFNTLVNLGLVSRPDDLIARDSLVVEVDEAGQVDIDFRYKRKPSGNNEHACPAAGFRVGSEVPKIYAVPAFSNLIGTVVATEIFPKVFDIADAE